MAAFYINDNYQSIDTLEIIYKIIFKTTWFIVNHVVQIIITKVV